VIHAAIEELEGESAEWVPNSNRRQPPENIENYGDEPDLTQEELHRSMQAGVKALEEALARAPEVPAGIGHNRPPEPLEPEPLNVNDRNELVGALAVLKSQLVDPPDQGAAATEALAMLEAKRGKLGKWLLQQGDVFTTEAVKEAGKQFGKWAPAAFWLWLMDLMFGVSQTVHAWLS
jgi:hypothetical protein